MGYLPGPGTHVIDPDPQTPDGDPQGTDPPIQSTTALPRPAVDFEIPGHDGQPILLSDYAGQPILLDMSGFL